VIVFYRSFQLTFELHVVAVTSRFKLREGKHQNISVSTATPGAIYRFTEMEHSYEAFGIQMKVKE
jgi:hypothetical protein